jgi:intracellular multiplication protein IcmC
MLFNADLVSNLALFLHSAVLPILWGVSYFLGLCFAFAAIFQFKVYGEMRSMMSYQTNIGKPLMTMFVAIVLLFFPDVYRMMMYTFFDRYAAAPFAYNTGTDLFDNALKATSMMVQIIGFAAFIRGWILLTRVVGSQQPGAMAKALTHIIAGLFAVNCYGVWQTVERIIGVNT